ncbi:hypothetical protein LCGC14_1590500 [marine sediment metagenome]|uniref:DUF2283 domain-containing protein n=1 Tax=marine sediment metagenome TaxID=412755 RepID=A0A0F9KUT5_9ZZZZ
MAKRDGVTIQYDRDRDILYMHFGKNRKAVSKEIDDGVLLRVDPKTQEVVGITILYFSERKQEQKEIKGVTCHAEVVQEFAMVAKPSM